MEHQDGTPDRELEISPEQSIDFNSKKSRMLRVFFKIFTILEFGFLGFILYDLFRKYVLTGNLDWWKK